MKTLLSIFTFLLFISNSVSQEPKIPRTYTALKTESVLKIDGKDSENSWKEARWSTDFIDIEGKKKAKYQTNVKMLWNETYLYFFAKMEEPHIWGTLKQRDTVIFYNNDFEIFIDPDGDTHNYYEFEMNALNTVWDLFIVKPYREPAPIIDSWDIQGLKTAVDIKGSLNNPSDEDEYWAVEIAIPWKVLLEADPANKIPANDFWRINFSRVNWPFELNGNTYSRKKDEKGNYLPEFNWVWSPQGVINMHEPEHWGYVYFSSEIHATSKKFEIPADEPLKWYLYELYRAQKAYYQKNKIWAANLAALDKETPELNGKPLRPEIEIHLTGWNISAKSPFSGKTYIIKEDGDLITKPAKHEN